MCCVFTASAKAKVQLTRKAKTAAFEAKTFKGKAGILWPQAKTKA